MRVNWFCPLPPARTAIADYAAGLLPALAEYVDLELWTDQEEWDPSIEAIATVRRFSGYAIPTSQINRADLNVYHVGNNAAFHEGIWRVSQDHPGMVVLHDLILQEFALGLGAHEYLAHMGFHHGRNGLTDGASRIAGLVTTDYLCDAYPLTDMATSGALAVLTHSPEAARSLRGNLTKPVIYSPMPYPATEEHRLQAAVGRRRSGPLRLISFGHIGHNRRIEKVLEALAGFEHRDAFQFDLYGRLFDETYIAGLVERYGLLSQVHLHGFVPEAELRTALESADLAVNLRYPTRGEASYSQLLIWDHALPAMVTQADWYASLPSDSVAFVRPESEVEDIRRHLTDLLHSPEQFRSMGRRGRARLLEHHAPASFARIILACAEQAPRWHRRSMAFQLSAAVAREGILSLPLQALDPTFESVARHIEAIATRGDSAPDRESHQPGRRQATGSTTRRAEDSDPHISNASGG